MKALSLWQPWASAIAVDSKRIETRSWSTRYRGLIAIHAAKRLRVEELMIYGVHPIWLAALRSIKKRTDDKPELRDVLPFGAIVATAELVKCIPTERIGNYTLDTDRGGWTERTMGDFSPGRSGWVLKNIHRLETPVPCVGRQGLFNIDDSILDQREAKGDGDDS